MYPYPIIGNIDLYTILIAVGIIACFVICRLVADKINMNGKIFNFALVCAGAGILAGLFSSVLFQALFNIAKIGKFVIDKNTGATFAGGLIGGAVTFIIIYFLVGKKIHESYVIEFRKILITASCGIPIAHAFGRLGCLMAGCCYGKETTSFIGIHMVSIDKTVLPTQLFESLFLFALCAFLVIYSIKGHQNSMSIYMISYGIWRILIEFVRDDDRGHAITGILTPAQEICTLMIIGGIVLYFLYERKSKLKANEA